MIALGDKYIDGKCGTVFSAGDIEIENADIKRIYAAGEINVRESRIGKLRSAGDINGQNIMIKKASLAGEINLKGECRIPELHVYGDIEAEYLLCDFLVIGSPKGTDDAVYKTRIGGYIKTDVIKILKSCMISGEIEARIFIAAAKIEYGNELKAEIFCSLSGLYVPTVNAEKVFILAGRDVSVKEINGSDITISNSFSPTILKKVPGKSGMKSITGVGELADIGTIDGDTVKVEYANINEINGTDVIVGDMAVVNRVTYRNKLSVSEKAIVAEAIKLQG